MEAGWVARLGRSSLELVVPAEASTAVYGDWRAVLAGSLHDIGALAATPGLTQRHDEDDATLVLRALDHAGDSLLPSLRGAFGLVALDQRRGTGFCVRDPLGVYPLFTARAGADLLVSRSIAALLAQPEVSRDVNLAALGDHLLHRWPDLTETYFDSIRRVPPGHVLEVEGGRIRLRRYWEPVPLEGPVEWLREEDELVRFDELLVRAVSRELDGGPTAIFLSGGLDSVSVAAVASATTRERGIANPLALSLIFPHPDVNEESVQRAVAKSLALEHVVVRWSDAVGPHGLVQDAVDVSARSPAPLINYWAPVYDRLAAAAIERCRATILTGSGGDEWLGVSPSYAADLMRTFGFVRLARLASAQRLSYQLSDLRYLRNVVWRFSTRLLLVDAARRVAPAAVRARRLRRATTMPTWVAPDTALRGKLVARALKDDPGPLPGAPRSHPRFYFDELRSALGHPLVAMELEETFEQGRRAGADIRGPYWDPDLVSMLCRTPPELLNRGGRSKGLVREALARRFPELGFRSQRKVIATRFATSLLEQEAPTAWKALGGPKRLAEAGIVEPGLPLERVLTPGIDSRTMHSVWDILSLEGWLRSHR